MYVKYNKIGKKYNLTRKADKYLTKLFLRALNPKKEGIYLDIGCGTGNYTNEMQKNGVKFIGIDPSNKMLEKAKMQNPLIDWRIGTADNTGLPENSVDGIIGVLTIHHWSDLRKCFSELNRVLKTNSPFAIFTSTPEQMEGYWLNHYFPKMMMDSTHQMPSYKKIEDHMESSGFKINKTNKYFIKSDLEDMFLYCGKHKPELYFDRNIRSNISSFSDLANKEEVEKGLTNLREDIDNGKINSVISSYENKLGDYLIIVGIKAKDEVILDV